MWKAHQQHGQTRKGEENIALYWSYHSDFSDLPSAHRTPPLLSIVVLGHVYYCISYSFEIVVIWRLHYHYKSILKLLSSSVPSVLMWMSSLCSCPCSVILVSCFNRSRLILVFPLLICQIGMFFALTHTILCLFSFILAVLDLFVCLAQLGVFIVAKPHDLWICLYQYRQLLLVLPTFLWCCPLNYNMLTHLCVRWPFSQQCHWTVQAQLAEHHAHKLPTINVKLLFEDYLIKKNSLVWGYSTAQRVDVISICYHCEICFPFASGLGSGKKIPSTVTVK